MLVICKHLGSFCQKKTTTFSLYISTKQLCLNDYSDCHVTRQMYIGRTDCVDINISLTMCIIYLLVA